MFKNILFRLNFKWKLNFCLLHMGVLDHVNSKTYFWQKDFTITCKVWCCLDLHHMFDYSISYFEKGEIRISSGHLCLCDNAFNLCCLVEFEYFSMILRHWKLFQLFYFDMKGHVSDLCKILAILTSVMLIWIWSEIGKALICLKLKVFKNFAVFEFEQ